MRRRKCIYTSDPAINEAAETPIATIQVWISTGLPRIGSRTTISIYVTGFNLRSSVPNLICSGYQMIGVRKNRNYGKRILRAGRPNAPVGFLRQYGTTVTRKHFLPMQRQALLLILATLMASSAATAQAPPTPATPPAQTAPPAPPRNATGCAPTQSMPQQGTIAPQGTTTTDPQAEPLSDKLARSDGVLCPPTGVDPEIRAPTPETGNMPVIPPPGSPGGDPTIRPK